MSVIATLQEKTTLNNPFYVFEVSNRENTQVFSVTDASTSKKRYNSFSLTEGSTFTLPVGEYDYKIHEMSQENDIDLNNSVSVVETGIFVVYDDNNPFNSYGGSTTFASYEG